MPLLDHLKPRSITAQITGLVAISVIAGVALVMAVVLHFDDVNPRYRLASLEAQIGMITRLIKVAKNEDEVATALAIAHDMGVRVRRVALADLDLAPQGCCRTADRSVLARRLEANWDVDLLDVVPPPGSTSDQAAIRLDDRNALLIEAPFSFNRWVMLLAPSALTLVTVLLFVVFLSAYALRQTLGVWSIGPGPSVQLPLLGPSNVRDSVGKVVDIVASPTNLIGGAAATVGMVSGAAGAVDGRARTLSATDSLERNSLDYYAASREAAAQRRAALVDEGKEGKVDRTPPAQ